MPDMPRCPNCGSLDVLVLPKQRRRCWACSGTWSARKLRDKARRKRQEGRTRGTS